jgi:hypothetical protein
MCVSVAEASFEGTIIYLAEVKINGTVFNVLGYGNTARNLSNTPNAMLLHFPAVNVSGSNILDVSEYREILQDMKDITDFSGVGFSRMDEGRSFSSVQFIQHGIYDILIARNPKDIPAALEQVAPEKRPPLRQELFDFYGEAFPDWPVALCCFNNQDVKGSDPLFWFYEPQQIDTFVFPGIDSHDGSLPNLNQKVRRDQYLVFGSYQMPENVGVSFCEKEDLSPHIQPYIADRLVGFQVPNTPKFMRNGDFAVSKENAIAGKFNQETISSHQPAALMRAM